MTRSYSVPMFAFSVGVAYERLGATGTPTIVAGGHSFTGVPTRRVLDSLVDAELRTAAVDRHNR